MSNNTVYNKIIAYSRDKSKLKKMAIGANAKAREAGYGWNLAMSTAQKLILYCERLIFNLGITAIVTASYSYCQSQMILKYEHNCCCCYNYRILHAV